MKTAAEIIAFLELELVEAYHMYDLSKGKDAQKAMFYLVKATTITHILEEIKED